MKGLAALPAGGYALGIITFRLRKPKKDFKIAIVGGGVCGLTCAVALAREGVSVDIFEAAPKFGEIGAGIGVGPNATRILRKIGVLDDVLAKSDEPSLNMRTFLFISGMADHEVIYDYPAKPEDTGVGIHRASFLDALVQSVNPSRTHFNKRCTEVLASSENPSRSIMYFEDGTTFEADVVLGADGIKSAVRGAIVGKEAAMKHTVFSNTIAYRGLVPNEEVKAAGVKIDLSKRPICFVGKGKHIIIFPIRNGQIINVVAFGMNREVPIGEDNLSPGEPWVTHVSKEQLLQEYEGWGSDVINLLGCIERPSKWSIHVVYPPLETYVKGRVALLGDAAHGMLPHLGAGAGQGLEDAYLLAKLFGHPQTNKSNLEDVLSVYNLIRRPRAQMVWENSLICGNIYEGCGSHGDTPDGIRHDLTGMWDEVWHHAVDHDAQEAVRLLKEWGVFR